MGQWPLHWSTRTDSGPSPLPSLLHQVAALVEELARSQQKWGTVRSLRPSPRAWIFHMSCLPQATGHAAKKDGESFGVLNRGSPANERRVPGRWNNGHRGLGPAACTRRDAAGLLIAEAGDGKAAVRGVRDGDYDGAGE